MKALGIFFVSLLLLLPARAQDAFTFSDPAFVAQVTTTAPIVYIVKQGFEGSGYDNSESWTTSVGSPDPDYTTVVLDGSQSLFLNLPSAATRVRTDFANQDEVWLYFMVRLSGSAPAGDRGMFGLSPNGSSTMIDIVAIDANRKLRLTTANLTSTTALALDTTYHVFVHYRKGTGANATIEASFSTDGTKPTSGSPQYIGTPSSSQTIQCGRIWCGHTATATFTEVIDKVRAAATAIGDNPT